MGASGGTVRAQGAVAGRVDGGRASAGPDLEDAVPSAFGADVREQREVGRIVEQPPRGGAQQGRHRVADVQVGDAEVRQVIPVQEAQGVGVHVRGGPAGKHLEIAAGSRRSDARRCRADVRLGREQARLGGQGAPQPGVELPVGFQVSTEVQAVAVVVPGGIRRRIGGCEIVEGEAGASDRPGQGGGQQDEQAQRPQPPRAGAARAARRRGRPGRRARRCLRPLEKA